MEELEHLHSLDIVEVSAVQDPQTAGGSAHHHQFLTLVHGKAVDVPLEVVVPDHIPGLDVNQVHFGMAGHTQDEVVVVEFLDGQLQRLGVGAIADRVTLNAVVVFFLLVLLGVLLFLVVFFVVHDVLALDAQEEEGVVF